MELGWIIALLLALFGCYCIHRGCSQESGKRRMAPGRDTYAAQQRNTAVLTGRFREIGTSFQVLGEILAKEPQDLRQEREADFWKLRLAESRQAMAEQYLELARMMEEWEQELACTKDVTEEWNKQLKRQMRNAGITVKQALLVESGRQKEACLTVQSSGKLLGSRELVRSMKGICGVSWRVVPGEKALITRKPCRIMLEAEMPYRVSFGIARRVKQSAGVSGDSFSQQWLPGGKTFLALCDGMGSGERAFQESEYALELLERLMEAGYSLSTAMQLVHTALLFGQEGERHPVAMDGCVLDLWNGMGRIVKAGGVCSFLWRNGEVKQLRAEALPAGILAGTEPGEVLFHIRSGDVLVMLTDGVLEEIQDLQKEDAFEALLKRGLADGGTEAAAACEKNSGRTYERGAELGSLANGCALARWLLEQITEHNPDGPGDDMTILTAAVGKKY